MLGLVGGRLGYIFSSISFLFFHLFFLGNGEREQALYGEMRGETKSYNRCKAIKKFTIFPISNYFKGK